jgi:hypothetical protein
MPTPRRIDHSIYRLKITLRGARPPIWRRIEAPGAITLAALHDLIQAAMGWYDGHLHQFDVGGEVYGDPAILEDLGVLDERTARLNQVAPRVADRLRYLYDFGDDWEHVVLVEAIGSVEPGVYYPRCTAGRRACPPEDCGGVWGYAELLAAIGDPEHPEHEEMVEWLDEDFDPAAFDLAAINARLQR